MNILPNHGATVQIGTSMSRSLTLVVAALAAFPWQASAQGTWATIGLGRAYFGGFAELGGQLSVAHQFRQHVVAARGVAAGDILGGVFANPGQIVSVQDAGVMFGHGTRPGLVYVSAAAGVGVASVTRNAASGSDRTTSHFGVPLEVQLFFRPTHVIGLGIYGYGDLNSVKSFWGWTFSVALGHWR